MRRQTAVGALVLFAVAASACGGGDDGDQPSASPNGSAGGAKTSIVIGLSGEPLSLDPHLSQDGLQRRIGENVYERLVDRDLDDPTVLVPSLAASLPDNVEPTVWEVPIREGVTFQNGEPFSASDAVASIERVLDPEFDSEYLSSIDSITAVEAVDDALLRITTSEPDPLLPARLYLVAMVPESEVDGDRLGRNPVGTGPYSFVAWTPGQEITLEANADYWGDAPPIDDVTFRFLPEDQTRLAALQSGEIDLAVPLAPEQSEDVPQLIARDGLEFPYLRIKNYEGPLADLRVRQAIAQALDVEAYVEELYSGRATPADCQPLGPASFGYNPDLKPYEFDPEAARQLVEESDYNGEPIRFIVPTERWPKLPEMAEAITAQLHDVGLNVELAVLTFDAWLDEFLLNIGEGQPDMSLSSTSNDLQDADRMTSLVGDTGTLSSYSTPGIDDAMVAARVELDVERREGLYHDLLEDLCEDVGIVSLMAVQDLYGASEDLIWTPRVDNTTRVAEMSFKG